MSKLVETFNHGTSGIDLTHLPTASVELRPVELHRKEDGAVDDMPSYCMVLRDANGQMFFAQITERTLLSSIEECKTKRP